jgi:hypothetical protein
MNVHMGSERTRVIAIFAAVLVIAGGAGFYFVKIYRPKQMLRDAQAEIADWEARWKAARACLLGPAPGSSKTSEALAVREMSPDPWNRGSCTSLMGKLVRGDAPQSGIDDVEHAWGDLEQAATHAATAFATHVAESTTRLDDPLPAALERLDDAYAKLRAAAKLPPAEQTGKPLPVAQVIPILDGSEPLLALEMRNLPTAHAMVEYGNTNSRLVQLTLVAGAAPKVGRGGPHELRGLPDNTWGAMAADNEVRIGAFDVEGGMAAPKTVPAKSPISILAVTGTLADGTVVYTEPTKLVVVHVKAGEPTAEPPIEYVGNEILPDTSAADADGRIALSWLTKDQKTHAKIVGEEPILLPSGASTQPCLSRDRAWVTSLDNLIGFGGGKLVHEETAGDLIGCTQDGAILRLGGQPQKFLVCTDHCRSAQLPAGAPSFATTTLVGGKLVAIVEHSGVLAVWREGAAPTFYSMPEPAHPVQAHEWPAMALTDGKVIDILARGAKTFAIVRIPATGS